MEYLNFIKNDNYIFIQNKMKNLKLTSAKFIKIQIKKLQINLKGIPCKIGNRSSRCQTKFDDVRDNKKRKLSIFF